MNKPLTQQIALAITVVNLAFFGGGIALAFQHEVKPLEVRASVQAMECAPVAAAKADCADCMTWGQRFPLPADMPLSEPIAQF